MEVAASSLPLLKFYLFKFQFASTTESPLQTFIKSSPIQQNLNISIPFCFIKEISI